MNSAVRVRLTGAGEDQLSIASSLLGASRNPNGQVGRPPPPASSQSATMAAQRAVNSAPSAVKPVKESPRANQRRENRSRACPHSRSRRRSTGSSSGAGGQRPSIHSDGAPPPSPAQ